MNILLDLVKFQHDKIDDVIKHLSNIIIERNDIKQNTKLIIDDLIKFFEIHFETEKNFFNIDNQHEIDHKNFIDRLKKISSDPVESLIFIKNWSESHYKDHDSKFLSN